MKKLFVLPVLAFGLLIGTQSISALDYDTATIMTPIQEKYIDLAVENLPQTVIDAVAKDYTGASIEKASAKEDASEFKLILKQGEKTMEVFCDADGNWIKK